jgi:DNA-binding NarL/FixJ family response regulator
MSVTIVVVDDDPEFRMMVRHLVGSLSGLTVVGDAIDGETGLALVLREQPTLLITDIVMPGALDGIGLTRRVRQLLPATKIILMSSYTEDAYQRLGSSSGADAFIHKAVLSSSLISAIRDLTGREFPGLGRPNGAAGESPSPAAPAN